MKVDAGSTNVSVYYYIVQDASATSPGEPVTGLLFSDIETGGSASYVRQSAARVDLTLITLASASATHADGGFILVDDTNMPGLYRCDYPDAAFVAGVDQTFLQIVVASGKNAVAAPILVDIEGSIAQSGDSFSRIGVAGAGLTALQGNLGQGIAQGGTSSTIQLASGETFATNELRGCVVNITLGTGKGQSRWISANIGVTDTCSIVPDWITTPDATAIYEIVQGAASMQAVRNAALIEGSFDRIANNWSNFFNNENTQTTKFVEDVGGQPFPGGRWTWSTATSGVPNSGRIRGNNATIASITELSIHQETADGNNLGVLISALRIGDKVAIFFAVNPDTFLIFNVSATPILTGSVYAVTGTVDSTAGTFVNSSINVGYIAASGGIGVAQQVITRAKGVTSQIIPITIQDSSSAVGGKLAGLVFNTAGLTAFFNRIGSAGAATAITLVTATKGTYTSSGFVAIDNTNMTGDYELHIPDAALADGADGVWVKLFGAANMVPVEIYIDLVSEIDLGTDDRVLVSADVHTSGQTVADNTALSATIGTPTDTDIATDIANVQTATDAIPTTAMRGTDGANTVVPDAAGVVPTAIENRQEMDSNSTQLAAIVLDTGTTLPDIIDDLAIKKNAAFSNFEFLMVLASDGRTPATGLTVTGQRSIDGGAFSGVSGTIAEVSNGIYQFDALAADTNGDVITWRFLSATADDTFVTFKTVQ